MDQRESQIRKEHQSNVRSLIESTEARLKAQFVRKEEQIHKEYEKQSDAMRKEVASRLVEMVSASTTTSS